MEAFIDTFLKTGQCSSRTIYIQIALQPQMHSVPSDSSDRSDRYTENNEYMVSQDQTYSSLYA
mgnify:CR=1 FL=1